MEFANKVRQGLLAAVFVLVVMVGVQLFCDLPVLAEPAEIVLPGLSGQPLLEQLAAQFAPQQLLSYNAARDLMFSQIDFGPFEDGRQGIECFYSGYQTTLPAGSDPSLEADRKGINAEHLWPQSKGAKAVKSDLHNLYPVRMSVNSTRSNYPFAEIPDRETIHWFRKSRERKTVPRGTRIGEYSEFASGRFEPRDSKKGDVARVLFYFRTLYPDLADAAFFDPQRTMLCRWAAADPIDATEVRRSHAIAASPQGNENPFVLDATLPERTYCADQ